MDNLLNVTHEEKLKVRNKEICKVCQEILDDETKKLSIWGIAGEIEKKYITDIQQRIGFEKEKIAQRQIYEIVIDNVKISRAREKLRRFCKLRNLEKDKKESDKDIVDILKAEREEIEGDTPLIDQSIHKHVSLNINSEEFRQKSTKDKINLILGRK